MCPDKRKGKEVPDLIWNATQQIFTAWISHRPFHANKQKTLCKVLLLIFLTGEKEKGPKRVQHLKQREK